MCNRVIWSAIFALHVFGAGALFARDELEEVVVTAQYREQAIQDFAGALSAFDEDGLERYQIAGIEGLQGIVSNITFTNTNAVSQGSLAAFIRGVGVEPGLSPGVGIYIDELYLPKTRGAVLDVYDLRRIEVLKGPQGTLYGRNTIGGAVKYVTKTPSEVLEGRVGIAYGNRDLREMSASASGPLIADQVKGRLALLRRQRDGWQNNVASGGKDHEFGEDDTWAARVNLLWDGVEGLDVRLSYDVSDLGGRPTVPTRLAIPAAAAGINRLQNLAPSLTGGRVQGLGYPPDNYLPSDENEVSTAGVSAYERGFHSRADHGLLSVSWDLSEDVILRSHTGYIKYDQRIGVDFDGSELLYIEADPQRYNEVTYSQEFQLLRSGERSNLLLGLYLLQSQSHYQLSTTQTELMRLVQRQYASSRPADDRERSAAAYINWEYDLRDRLHLTLGGRYSKEEIKLDQEETVLISTLPFMRFSGIPATSPMTSLSGQSIPILNTPQNIAMARAVVPTLPASIYGTGAVVAGVPDTTTVYQRAGIETWSDFSPKAALAYDITDDMLLYGSVSRGFKAGGFNSRAGSTTAQPFDPETVVAYALGLKSSWPQLRIRANAEVFYSDYTDKQLASTYYDPATGALINLTRNVGAAEISGAELELEWATPLDGLRLHANLGYLDAKIVEFKKDLADGSQVDIADTTALAYTPDWTANIGFTYEHKLGTGIATLNANAAYRSDSWLISPTDLSNPFLTENTRYKANTIVNARFAYLYDDRIQLALEGRNLTDERFLTSAFETFFITGGYNEPRTWALHLKYYLH